MSLEIIYFRALIYWYSKTDVKEGCWLSKSGVREVPLIIGGEDAVMYWLCCSDGGRQFH